MYRFFLIIILTGCTVVAGAQKKMPFGTADYIRAMKHVTDVMVNDVTNPVAASRYYAYVTLAANETICQVKKEQLRPGANERFYSSPKLDSSILKNSEPSLAVILAIYQAGVRFVPSGYLLKSKTDSLLNIARKKKLQPERINATEALVKTVVDATVSYAYTDGFVKMSGLRRFTPTTGDEYWQPTAPGFMSAMEPYWSTLRPFIIDSVGQVSVEPPLKYSTDTTSAFYKQMMEVYRIGKKPSPQEAVIANFWDCNPFALQQVGHLEFGIKKISPGGHWIGITGIACKKSKADLFKTAYAHTLVSTSMADAFICCWNTKYKYNRVRPETAIKKLVDPSWQPLLQTPPFPEYSSGHSVVSAVSAAVLTEIFGDNFPFTDDTETEFGLPVRKFRSFREAANEAAISRLYGGIHFRDAIENGRKEGLQIAEIVIGKMRTKK